MADVKPISQPSDEAELALLRIIEDTSEDVMIGGRKYRIRGLRKGTRIKVTSILKNCVGKTDKPVGDKPEEIILDAARQDKEDKICAKCAAAYILNSYWTLRFMWGFAWSVYWRFLYYIRQYTDADYYELISLCKKKAEKQTSAYTMNIMLLTATAVTTMSMTREEVERIRLGKSMEQPGVQQKSFQP